MNDDPTRPTNRLSRESSPYLLQHQYNPVDWYPWGEEALARARDEDKPILLSVGYSACHWCHVMERESFENEKIAALMNDLYVNVKVDREERPDVDAVYMEAVQALSGHGGWPMTVFLLPDGKPFYAGTYYPPADRHGMPGFPRVLTSVAQSYRRHREQVERGAAEIATHLGRTLALALGTTEPDAALLTAAGRTLLQQVDPDDGGTHGAPKFPMPHLFEFLLRQHARSGDAATLAAVEITLEHMAHGGIYDQLGGGFHRYSTDERWLVPHFEKMLYDNALLVRLYLHAWQVTGKDLYRRVVEQTIAYLVREMSDPAGGFYSAQDADSEGVEGKFFVWTPADLAALLPARDAKIFAAAYDVSEAGNFEHASILHVVREPQDLAGEHGATVSEIEASLARSRALLLAARGSRVAPGRDEKVLAGWNGLALAAVAEAAAVLGRDDWRERAVACAAFVLDQMRREDGRLLRVWTHGVAKIPAYLEDYSFLIDGLLWTYQATFDSRWLQAARELTAEMVRLFRDEEGGGFFDTASDHERLVGRPKNVFDNAVPAASSVAAGVLLRLSALSGEEAWEDTARTMLAGMASLMAKHPTAFGWLLAVADDAAAGLREVVIAGEPGETRFEALRRAVFAPYVPNKVVAGGPPAELEHLAPQWPLLAGRGLVAGAPAVYVCARRVCQAPVVGADRVWSA